MFEDFIINAKKYRYNLICYITARDKQQPTYVDDARISGDREIHNNETTPVLKSLVTTLNFIGFWVKHFQRNYQ